MTTPQPTTRVEARQIGSEPSRSYFDSVAGGVALQPTTAHVSHSV